MPNPTAFLRYSNRGTVKRSGGRYEYSDIWQVPGIISVNSPDGDGTGAINRPGTNTWLHEALFADNLPQIGDQSADGGMVVVALQPRSTADQGTAEVEVKWQEDPLTLPTEVHYFSAGKIKPAWTGAHAAPGADPVATGGSSMPIRNTAKDRFNPPVTFEAPLEQIRITKHVSLSWHDSIDWSQYVKRWNNAAYDVVTNDPDKSANSSTRSFTLVGSLFLADKQAPEVKEPYLHRILTCTFLFDPDLFGIRVANLGPRANFTADNKPAGWSGNWPTTGLCPVIDSYGNPFGGLAELNEDGSQMFPTTLTDPTTMPDPVVYAWYPTNASGDVYAADFNDLSLFTPERTLVV
jgi:hypothetical protein